MPLRDNSTQIYDDNQRNRTATHLSTNIIISVNGRSIGALQKLGIREQRTIQQIDEIGTDGHIDSAPKSSTNISGDASKIRFAGQRIAAAFDRGFVHVHSQRVPFDIVIQDRFAGVEGGDNGNVVITTIRNVWINSMDTSYNAGDFVITDSMGWEAESIESVLSSGSNVVTSNNGKPLIINPFESSADRGDFRGALDAAGLLNAFDGGLL